MDKLVNAIGGALSVYRPKLHPYCPESEWSSYQGAAGPVTFCKVCGRTGNAVTTSKEGARDV